MNKMPSNQQIALTLALTLAVVGFSFRSLAKSVKVGNSPATSRNFPREVRSLLYLLAADFEPPNDGAPGKRKDAGGRPGCPASAKPFTALVPGTNLGLTVAEQPTFWLYIPYEFSSPHLVELVLRDENTKKEVYRTQFSIEKGAGIIGWQLPKDAPTLQIDKKYRWRFDFFCHPGSEADYLSVDGVVMRKVLSAELRHQLETATPQERIDLYGKNGLWHEMLTELIELHRSKPQDDEIATQWADLLRHRFVRLEELISEPIL